LLYEILRARFRHDQVIEVERRLKEHVLDLAIDQTALYLLRENGARALIVGFTERLAIAAVPTRMERLPSLPRVAMNRHSGHFSAEEVGSTSTKPIAAAGLAIEHVAIAPIETGMADVGEHGFIATSGPEASATGVRVELLQHFAVALGQRLVDYHKDQ
jgi:hypothetical protein